MTQQENMTHEQAEEELRQLRKVFHSVRLLTQEKVYAPGGRRPCYAQWKRVRPCENCVARRALEEKSGKSKLEYLDKELYQVTASYVLVDGKPCVLEMTQKMDRSLMLDPDDSFQLLSTITDQTEKLYRDPATGAYNRRYYDENYRNRSMTAGVALLDLDDLKLSNDVYGRAAGDSVLETAVNVIRRSLEEKDRLIRYSGDELLLLLPDIAQDRFNRKLEKIRLQLRTASVPGYSRIQMSASIGGVWVEDEELSVAVDHAERLMQYARIQKNTVVTERQTAAPAAARPHCRQSVLIVDDSPLNRSLLSRMLGDQFDTAEAACGEDCLRLLEQNPTGISIVLLDIHMDGMDGFAVLEAMSQRRILDDVPVIMISSEDTVDAVRRAFDLGASDYISRPFDAKVVYQRVSNTIRLYAKQRRLSTMVADQVYEKEKLSRMLISILSCMVERRSGESHAHVRHIGTLTSMLLARLAQKTDAYPLTQEMRRTISMAAVLRDIGKTPPVACSISASACRPAFCSCAGAAPSSPRRTIWQNHGRSVSALRSMSRRSISVCAPFVRASTRPGFGESAASSRRASAARSPSVVQANSASLRVVSAQMASSPCARLREQTATGPPQTRQRRISGRESFSPAASSTSRS